MAAALTARHRWMANRIAEGFDVSVDAATAFLQRSDTTPAVADLLAGTGPATLMVFHQPRDHRLDDGTFSPGTGEAVLFLSTGADVPLRGRAVYFLRRGAGEVKTDKASDGTLLCGELNAGSDSLLNTFSTECAAVYEPVAAEPETDMFGKASAEQTAEFREHLTKFIGSLDDSVRGMGGGITLRKPPPGTDLDAALRAATTGAGVDPATVSAFQALVTDWGAKITKVLEAPPAAAKDKLPGPRTILAHWRARQTALTSVTEQLKAKECKAVLATLQAFAKSSAAEDASRQAVFTCLRQWKAVDVAITEGANEAKDNVKYLQTLEKFIEPLYSGQDPAAIVDTLPALLNSIKMIHTIARYFNTKDRMEGLFVAITNQMIATSIKYVVSVQEETTGSKLWDKDPQLLVGRLEACLRLNEAYQETYTLTRERLATVAKGKQFDFNERAIFGKFDLFCRRAIKLIDLFSTIHQFTALASHNLEGMEALIADFFRLVTTFKRQNHQLLAFELNDFDRDYVEFNVRISELENKLQQFINTSFESITSIKHSLNLLRKFQIILQRESLRADLDDKFNIIFQTYGGELDTVQALYERHKHSPPVPRNLPPVAGNITWSRHLLKRIEEPMKRFEANQHVLHSKDAKRIIKTYNKVARTLVAFEYLWYQAWLQSIDTAKAGLQATLIIRHPDDGKLYVNFDQEILQLIREAKCLDRMGIEIPESAKIVLLQEDKFKAYHNDLSFALKEYARISNRIIPVTAALLRPHIADMEYKLRPGMITLTWTSMNIDAYKHHVHSGLQRLEELVTNLNDIIENRIEKNLKVVSKTLLVDLPANRSFSLDDFVKCQQEHIRRQAVLLQGKNVEIEHAVEDLLNIIMSYTLDPHIEPVAPEELDKLRAHYNHFMYQALLNCSKNSLNAIKKRVASRAESAFLFTERPFFEVDVQLAVPSVRLVPNLDAVQAAMNKCAVAVLDCNKKLWDWGQEEVPSADRATFFERVTDDMEIVRVILLLTGSIQGTKNQVTEYLDTFSVYDWLWKTNADTVYEEFMATSPQLEDYERELIRFDAVDQEIDAVLPVYNIGALSLDTHSLKAQLKKECADWKIKFSDNLHKMAAQQMEDLSDYMKLSINKLQRPITDIDSLRFVMNVLKEIRERESGIDMEINPVLDMYAMLEHYLPDGYMDKAEMDQKSVLRGSWRKLVLAAEAVTDEIAKLQGGFKKQLLLDVKAFVVDVVNFRNDYLANGPMVLGISPQDAMQRLQRYQEEFELRDRKYELYSGGEELFALKKTEYPELDATKRELGLLQKLYGLYKDVMSRMDEWKTILWLEVVANVADMAAEMENFNSRCKKMPKTLREWKAYLDLKKKIEDTQNVLPLLQELSKDSIKDRHWQQISEVTSAELAVHDPNFKLENLLEARLEDHQEDIEEICDSADKQLAIEQKLAEITAKWVAEPFRFNEWKGRGVHILMGVPLIIEELEEDQMNLQTMLTMRNVTPFREECQAKLKELSDTSETLELWLKVQMLWCSLESVFLGGDIARQMPVVAKKFAKVDKDWVKIMAKAVDTGVVLEGSANELLRTNLPVMYAELEKCQKNLEGYLEQKRNKFPRFYFVSNPVLLQVLSQGSDPLAVQPYYEKIFDSITVVQHDRKDKTIIHAMINRASGAEEVIEFVKPVSAKGNIEEWLMSLMDEQQRTMKHLCSEAAADVVAASSNLDSGMRGFVDNTCAQYALLGIQLIWTADVQAALEQCRTKKSAVKDVTSKATAVLSKLSSWCLQDLGSKMNRKKIETLVTIQVHQRDVVAELNTLHKQRKLHTADDFEWLKQARFFWQPEATDLVTKVDGSCRIWVTDVEFTYQYEYLGTKERLVITPLTDRCYITLAQAVGMNFGGAPAGPAGTGKTETVKDMGRAMGIYVVVTNCSTEMRYTDCAKIFKGLCQSGLWGCFDEFNRIELPVLSVVAQQVQAVNNARKTNSKYFQFPGDPVDVYLQPAVGFFITMNPPVKGYTGRQELPENLKALFRGVSMMVPDFEIIIKVKLCSVGYSQFQHLSKKFFVCYELCKEQLSKQRHYDFGLRNILSVLRTAGQTKRDNLEKDEDELLFRTLRDMNLSKLVAQDVPLFLSMLRDVFPTVPPPPKSEHPEVEEQIRLAVDAAELVQHEVWIGKVVQLYETWLVRHGIMITGPSGGGKSQIFNVLTTALAAVQGVPFRIVRINPKSFTSQQMFGETDAMTGEWTMGVFSAIWEKYNNRTLPYNTWFILDGPVDSIWIESMNTILDDNQILTLASGDRIPMTENTKIMFENEHLENASPATVSRCGIVYLSDVDLDWAPVVEAWVRKQPADMQATLRELYELHVGVNTPTEFGHLFDYLLRYTSEVQTVPRVGRIAASFSILGSLIDRLHSRMASPAGDPEAFNRQIESLFLYSIAWTLGSGLEAEDRIRMDAYLRKHARAPGAMPDCGEDETLFEYYVSEETLAWARWRPPAWAYPGGDTLDFSNLLVPTMDTTRSMYLLDLVHNGPYKSPLLMIGGPGTAKTSTALMFFDTFNADERLLKRINFSAFSSPAIFQATIDGELDKRGGKSFGPSNGKKMTVFVDDVSMPTINKWGDQPTNEIVRQLIEHHGYYFLDKDKRGDFKQCEDLQHVAAMQHPTSGRNDIPNRMKRQYVIFNLVLPSVASIDDLYGQMLRGRFTSKEFGAAAMSSVVNKLTAATIELWRLTKTKMLPTPAKFHYVFNMRELSRVFQGVLTCPKQTLLGGGQQTPSKDVAATVLRLWKHECACVFRDKLATQEDKTWFNNTLESVTETNFGDDLAERVREESFFVDFFRDDVYDEDEVFLEFGPKIYEPGGGLEAIKARCYDFMEKHNVDHAATPLNLVLFEDALRHLIRISRVLGMPRGSALLVGVGGSGKQSLTKLAAYIARSHLFQITLTKSYNVASLFEDLHGLFKEAGHARKSVTFLFTDAEIKDEAFLEYVNSVLATGEVVGLFAKDEMLGICADLRAPFVKARPGMAETTDNLKRYFVDCVRDNLHVVLCMSPVNPLFPVRARMFPALISGCTIDWFLPWPQIALINVAEGLLNDFEMEASADARAGLVRHVGTVHQMVGDVCTEYYATNRRSVYQTPKSYLSFINNYKTEYTQNLTALKDKEARVNLGLQKLIKGAEDVEAMKIVLAEEQVKLDKATKDTNAMLGSLQVSSAEAQQESAKVADIKENCESEAARITAEKEACEADLAKAQPFLDEANTAIASIKAAHINEVKKLPKPSDIIRLVFDGVLVLFAGRLDPVSATELYVNKKTFEWMSPSWAAALTVMADTKFLQRIQEFEKDKMNEETIELLCAYIDMEDFTPQVAKAASAAAEGLCTWVRAMRFYHQASKVVKPKLEALAIAEGQLEVAMKALAEAEARLAACNARLKELQDAFDNQMAEKKKIEDGALALQRKMEQASKLINGLSGERVRWTEDSNNFADKKTRLVGDTAVACAFTSYCGPFNQEFRKYLINDKFIADARDQSVPVSSDVDVVSFLADVGTIGDWNMEGLPTDPLSSQNGILVTQAARYPLLIDPQGQAISWIKNKEKDNMPLFGVTALNHPQLKDQLEFCMQEGRSFVVAGVEETLDPLLDPVLEKQIIVRGRRKYINIADKNVELHPDFRMYFITRLPNPHFSPELQAKTTVVDFTVTMKGLEEQLLGRVIAKEQKALEDLLNKVLEEVNDNTKSLIALDAELLNRLSANSGNLLDDEDLIDVLANTKAKAAEVKEKLLTADDTKRSINEKREQFRPVATRGSVLYFSIVDMSNVNVMYQTSLAQFTELFMLSMDKAKKASLAAKRVLEIIDTMTYLVYRYVNKGLYEVDKLLFVFIVTVKIMVSAGVLEQAEVTTFLRGGAALDINSIRKKPKWMSDDAWLNVVELSNQSPFFKALPDNIMRNVDAWRALYDDNEPENLPIPDFELALNDNKETGSWLRLLLLRCLRIDRTLLVAKDFVKNNAEMGPRYTEPVTDTIEMIHDDMTQHVPVIFLLSAGADPTDAIQQLARRKKTSVVCVSLGQGQEPVAMKAVNAAAVNGTWVLLQNCELGLPLMDTMEDVLLGMRDTVNEDFRLFITCLPHVKFPLGLLQMCTKVTNEPPQGLRAGIMKSYNVMVDQDRLERIDTKQWRQLLYALCFLHSIVLERRKFGALGWCQHYDFNSGDLGACMMFLEKHLYSGTISWPTLTYMVGDVQYGGKISDYLDRRLFNSYTHAWVAPRVLADGFTYNPAECIARIPNDFTYTVPDSLEVADYRAYGAAFPEIDSPEVFGLHPNADLTYRVKEVTQLLRTFGDTQPRQSGGKGGASLEDVVTEKATELESRLPEPYVEEEYRARIRKLGGMEVPSNIFLFQEIQRFQRVIGRVGKMLKAIKQAIRGEVVMTETLVAAMGDIFDAKVPFSWIWTPGMDEFSWDFPVMGLWFTSFLERDNQYRTWLNTGRPFTYWLTGFFNPQGFLTAMKQEVTRLHKAQSWALDDVAYFTEVTEFERVEQVRAAPKEGVYIHGLFLDACAWSKAEGTMVESAPKKLFATLPVLYVTAMTNQLVRSRREMFGSFGPYECPCYKYAERTDRNLIFMVNLVTRNVKPLHWILRGAAVVCSTHAQ